MTKTNSNIHPKNKALEKLFATIGKNPQTLLVLINSGAILLLLMLILATFFNVVALKNKPAPTLVIDPNDGSSSMVYAEPHGYRPPAAINRFISETLTLAMAWGPKVTKEGKLEKGALSEVESVDNARVTYKIPTEAVIASYSFESSIRPFVLEGIIKMLGEYDRKSTYVFQLGLVSPPERLHAEEKKYNDSQFRWRVTIASTIEKRDMANGSVRLLNWNRQLYIRSVPVNGPNSQLGSNLMQRAAEEIRRGLEIYDVKNLDPNQL